MFGDMSEWAIIVAVATAVAGCILFVINQISAVRDENADDLAALRKEFTNEINSLRKDITRVDDETTRKVQVAHDRINSVEKEMDDIERNVMDKILQIKDQLIEVYKNK